MTEYKPYAVKLSFNQNQKLVKAIGEGSPFTLRLKSTDLTGSNKLFLTSTQINKIKKAKRLNKGVDIDFSKTQVSKMRSMVGSGIRNRRAPPQPKTPTPSPQQTGRTGEGLRNRPFNINDYAQYRPPPFVGSWSQDDNRIKKKQFPMIGMQL